MAVENLGDHVAARDDVRLVPVVHFDDLQQFVIAVLQRSDDLRTTTVRDVDELTAHSEKAAPALFVDLTGEAVLGVDVALVPLQDPVAHDGAASLLRTRRQMHAPDLNAAVGGIDAVLDLQLEIGRLAAAPDQEAVFFQRVLGSRLTHDRAAFDAPELRIAIPALQGGSVEDRHEPFVFVEREWLRTAAGCLLCGERSDVARGQEYRDDCRRVSRLHDWTLSHCLDLADASTASVTRSVASPSRKVGGWHLPFAADCTNSEN